MLYFNQDRAGLVKTDGCSIIRRCPMREFKCSNLGNKCTWKHIATEELLSDMVALHLRQAHGILEVDPGLLAKIRNSFSRPSNPDIKEEKDVVMKEYACSLAAGCSWRYMAMTEELIVDGTAVHARDAHGIREFTPEMIAAVKRASHEWSGDRKA
jgi:predicted small metal-binding protein